MGQLFWPLLLLSQKANHIMEDISADTGMAAMAITLERDLLMLTVIMVDILEDTDMAVMVTTLERDLPMLTAIMEDILEDTVMVAMVTILERDLPKLMPILSSSDTTHTEMDILSQLMPLDTI